MGFSGKGLGHSLKPVGYEPNPNAALKQCRAATSLSVVDKNAKVQAAAHAEEVQHGTHGHGKEERAETADQMLDPASGGDGRAWTSTWGKEQGQDHQTQPEDH